MSAGTAYDANEKVDELLKRARTIEKSGGPADKVRALRQAASRLALGLDD